MSGITYNSPEIISIIPRDGALLVKWLFDERSLNDTDEVLLDVHNKDTNVLIQVYIPNLSNLSFRVPNLVNNNEYIIKITQYLSSGVELASNSFKSIPRARPNATINITSVVVTESPDASFTTVIYYSLYDMLYHDALIKSVNLKLIEESRDEIKSFVIPEGSLLKNPPNMDGLVTFQEHQSFTINTLVDGTYLVAATLTNTYGTSVLSEVTQFIVKDMPNNVTDVEVLSGLNNAVQVKYKCIESVMVGFNITQFLVKYFKTNDPNNVMTKVVSNVDSNNVALYATSATINGNVIIDNLDNVDEYKFSVVAVNKRGESTPSVPVRGWAGLLDEITNVQVNYVTNTTLEASWSVTQKSYRFKTLKYAVMRNNVEIKTGNLGVNDVSLNFNDMNLLDGESVNLKLTPFGDIPVGFVPHTGEIMPDGLYSLTYIVESLPQLVFAKCDILFATSGINTKEVVLVGKVHSSQVTAMEFQTKLKTESSWTVAGTIDRVNLVVSGSNLTGSLTVTNLDLGQYDVQARAIYGAKSGPLTGLQGKVTSLDLPKINSFSVVQLSEELLQVQVVYDSVSNPDEIILDVYNNSAASGTPLKSISLDGAGAAVDSYTRVYTTSLSNISTNSLVYIKCSVKRDIDLSYYISGDNNAPAVIEDSITYFSFMDANSYYITVQGNVSTQSGTHGKIDVVMNFPYNADIWSRVKEIVLQRTSDNLIWTDVHTSTFDANTANIVGSNVVISVLDMGLVNGIYYKYRSFSVTKSTSVNVYPIFDELKYSLALPFLASEVSSASIDDAKIDENDDKLKVNASWVPTSGTYSTVYDVLLYSQNILLSRQDKVLVNSLTFTIDTEQVCNTLGLSFTGKKNAAELLYNKSLSIRVNPFIGLPSNDVVYASRYGRETNYLSYSGVSSALFLPTVVPNAVNSLTLISLSDTSATFSFEKSIVTEKKPLTNYILELSLSTTFTSVVQYIIASENNSLLTQTYTATELTPNTTYNVRIVAVNSLGKSNYFIGSQFYTSENTPGVGTVSVTQNVNDSLATCAINFTKINSSTYTVQNYLLSVFDSSTNLKIEDITLPSNQVLPYTYTGEFGKSYKFSVVAKLTNSLNEPSDSSQSISQTITICDKPIFHNDPVWSTIVSSGYSQVQIAIDPKGSETVTLILMVLPSDTNSTVNPVFTPPTPTIGNDGLFYYLIELPYHALPPKFIAVVSNIKGLNYFMDGF